MIAAPARLRAREMQVTSMSTPGTNPPHKDEKSIAGMSAIMTTIIGSDHHT